MSLRACSYRTACGKKWPPRTPLKSRYISAQRRCLPVPTFTIFEVLITKSSLFAAYLTNTNLANVLTLRSKCVFPEISYWKCIAHAWSHEMTIP